MAEVSDWASGHEVGDPVAHADTVDGQAVVGGGGEDAVAVAGDEDRAEVRCRLMDRAQAATQGGGKRLRVAAECREVSGLHAVGGVVDLGEGDVWVVARDRGVLVRHPEAALVESSHGGDPSWPVARDVPVAQVRGSWPSEGQRVPELSDARVSITLDAGAPLDARGSSSSRHPFER